MRIVTLLPSTTEILFAIGAGDDVVGVTFECDTPSEARERTVVSTSAMPQGLDAAGIDAFVAEALRRGEDLYHLDEGALAGLDADLVVTQDLCAVCAVDVSVVDDALAHLGCTADVLTIDPHTIAEVLDSIVVLGRATGHDEQAEALVESLHRRLEKVAAEVDSRTDPPPRVLVLEWTEPPYAPGHWVPEMVALAGAVASLGGPGERSVRITWEQALESRPDIVVCAPCGYHLDDSATLAQAVLDSGRIPAGTPVWAVDANASWARPGPRLVDGIEALTAIVAGREPDPTAARRLPRG